MIAFIGSVFSPYYAWAGRTAPADPENHVAMNVALYGGKRRWAMTERGRRSLQRSADSLRIGASGLAWNNGVLAAQVNEITAPVPRRLRGSFRLTPDVVQPESFFLDDAGRHRWRPIAPSARIAVEFEHPKLSWSGRAYFDTNDGDAPLAAAFSSWAWSRATGGAGTILYDVKRRAGGPLCLALNIDEAGHATPFTPPPEQLLPATLWRVQRATRADAPPRVVATMEDAPFYTRSHIESTVNGMTAEAIHESLSLDRFAAPWVKLLLPFRMPRV